MASRFSEEAVTRSPRSPFSPLEPFLPGLPLATELQLVVESKEKVMKGKKKEQRLVSVCTGKSVYEKAKTDRQ